MSYFVSDNKVLQCECAKLLVTKVMKNCCAEKSTIFASI